MRRIALDALLSSPAEIARVRDLLEKGCVAALPTETFYGLATSPWNPDGVARIFAAKGRDDGKPLPILLSGARDLARLGVVASEGSLSRWLARWPAPLTVVLPIRRPIPASRGGRTLAVRVPAAPALRRLLASTGPLTGTSANVSGSEPLAEPDDVARALGSALDVLVDGGRTPGGAPSTIVDGTIEPAVLLRAGAYPWP